MVKRGSIAAASRRHVGISLPAVRQDGERSLVRRDVAELIGEINAVKLERTRDSAFPEPLVSISKPVELENT